jgi:hypothetical protein
MRPYTLVGELLLTDGTTYTRLATYDAPDMETALRRAAAVVRRWRGERIVGHPGAAVRDIIEVQVGEAPAAPSRRSDGPQDQQESEQRQEEPPRFPHQQGGALLISRVAFRGRVR